MVHEIKCWPAFFDALKLGKQRFDMRLDDRGYKTNDELLEREWDPHRNVFTGRTLRFRVVYLMRGPMLGLKTGWVCMSVEPCGT